jgi:hypothetical protein
VAVQRNVRTPTIRCSIEKEFELENYWELLLKVMRDQERLTTVTGVPKSDRVLAFQPPERRHLTEFAVA